MTPLPIAQITLQPGFVDLGMGNPNLDLLPLELIRQSAQTYFAGGDQAAEPLLGNDAALKHLFCAWRWLRHGCEGLFAWSDIIVKM